MANLVLDPPQTPSLQLVASSGAPPRDRRYRELASLGAQARRLQRLVLSWSLEHGRAVNPDAMRVVLTVRQASGAPLTRWRTDDVWRLMMVDVLAWCRARRLPLPPGCAAAVLVMLDALFDTGELHADSDEIGSLGQALEECTGTALDDLCRATPRWT